MHDYSDSVIQTCDDILKYLSNKKDHLITVDKIIKEFASISAKETIQGCCDILIKRGFVKAYGPEHSEHLSISFPGNEFRKNGGFEAEKRKFLEEQEETSKDKKLNRRKLKSDITKNKFWIVGSVLAALYTVVDFVGRLVSESFDLAEVFISLFSKLFKLFS